MKLWSILVGVLIGTGVIFAPAPAAASSKYGTCERVEIPVAMSLGQPKNKKIVGTHCSPTSPSIMRSVDVMVPGGTYDKTYWDFPYNDYQYSYVDRTLQANRATFNFDRIGTGESSKPFSATVSYESDVYTLHQVIQWLKNSRNYDDVTTIGHSAGSMVAIKEAATHKDVDRLVVTGFLHSAGYKLLLDVAAGGLYPAILDKQFFGSGLDIGYLTTVPGKRGPAFYSSSADPNVIAHDEANKSFISSLEAPMMIAQILLPPALNSSSKVTAPVLTIAGDQDVLCGFLVVGANCSDPQSFHNHEKAYYPRAKNFTSKVVPDTGHNLPLHPSANQSFSAINDWIKAN